MLISDWSSYVCSSDLYSLLPLRPPCPRRLGPAGEPQRQHALDAGTDRLAEHRRSTVRRDGEDQRRAVDDGAKLEVAKLRLIDDVDRRSRLARGGDEAQRLAAVGNIGDGQRGAPQVRRWPTPGPTPPFDPTRPPGPFPDRTHLRDGK